MTDAQRAAASAEANIKIALVVQHVHTYSFTTKSDTARENADEVAHAASQGLITTEIVPGSRHFGRRWKVTSAGLLYLEAYAEFIEAQEVEAYEAKLLPSSDAGE